MLLVVNDHVSSHCGISTIHIVRAESRLYITINFRSVFNHAISRTILLFTHYTKRLHIALSVQGYSSQWDNFPGSIDPDLGLLTTYFIFSSFFFPSIGSLAMCSLGFWCSQYGNICSGTEVHLQWTRAQAGFVSRLYLALAPARSDLARATKRINLPKSLKRQYLPLLLDPNYFRSFSVSNKEKVAPPN